MTSNATEADPALPTPAATPRGIVCPSCGRRPLTTSYTRHRPGATVRVRKCRACGHRLRTVERVESARV